MVRQSEAGSCRNGRPSTWIWTTTFIDQVEVAKWTVHPKMHFWTTNSLNDSFSAPLAASEYYMLWGYSGGHRAEQKEVRITWDGGAYRIKRRFFSGPLGRRHTMRIPQGRWGP